MAGVNTGASSGSEGSYQNSRGGIDREVSLNRDQASGVNASPQGARGGSSSLGGERPASTDNASRDTFGNH